MFFCQKNFDRSTGFCSYVCNVKKALFEAKVQKGLFICLNLNLSDSQAFYSFTGCGCVATGFCLSEGLLFISRLGIG